MSTEWGWVKDNRQRPGFEYRYRFQTTDCDEIITDEIRSSFESVLSGGDNACVLEFRTKFIVIKAEKGDDEIVLGSQGFQAYIDDCNDEDGFVTRVCGYVNLRLQEYWMPDCEILKLAQDAFGLAKSVIGAGAPPRVIPMVAWVDVCTVQQDGETLDDAMDRAIRAEKLLPYEVFDPSCNDIDMDLLLFLIFELPRIRVEDVEQGLGLMKSCPICHRCPTVGSQITRVPSCAHAFHSHCIVGWMVKDKSKSCPLCLDHDDDKSS